MKQFIFYLLILLANLTFSQEKYLTRSGEIHFEASVPSFEEVAATNTSTTAILNTENGEIAALALVKGFRFKNALMEEHFNENYAESNRYPKATFKGTIKGYDQTALSGESTAYTVEGTIDFHGSSKTYDNIEVRLNKKNGKIQLKGEFVLKASDFNIEIPAVVKDKISQDITVALDFVLEKS